MRTPALHVLAFLPAPLQSQLRVALAGGVGHSVTVADRWDTFADAVRAEIADVVVVDPCADGTSHAAPLAVLLDAHPVTPAVIYTSVSPLGFQAIAELSRHSTHPVQQVVLHRYDDEPTRFRELIERQPGTALSVALLSRLAPSLSTLPPALARAVERLFRRPTEFHSVDDIAAAARITVRTAYRHLAEGGFSSPRALVVGARLLRAYAYARDPRLSLEAIAIKIGYSAPRILTNHMRQVVGVTPRAARRQVRPAEFVDALARWLCPTAGPMAPTARRRAAVLKRAPMRSGDRAMPGPSPVVDSPAAAFGDTPRTAPAAPPPAPFRAR